jgi:hypothetical protein
MSSREPKDIAEGIEYCIKNKDRMKNDCINNASKYKGEKFAASLRKFLFQ